HLLHLGRRRDDGDVAVPLDVEGLGLGRFGHRRSRRGPMRFINPLRLPRPRARIKPERRPGPDFAPASLTASARATARVTAGGGGGRGGARVAGRTGGGGGVPGGGASRGVMLTVPPWGRLRSPLPVSLVWALPTFPAMSTASTLR